MEIFRYYFALQGTIFILFGFLALILPPAANPKEKRILHKTAWQMILAGKLFLVAQIATELYHRWQGP